MAKVVAYAVKWFMVLHSFQKPHVKVQGLADVFHMLVERH